MVQVEPTEDLVFQPEQLARDGDVAVIAVLGFVVVDLAVVADLEQPGLRLVGVIVHFPEQALIGQQIEVVVDRDRVRRVPEGAGLREIVGVLHLSVVGVVVLGPLRPQDLAVHQRRAEVVHRRLLAVIVRHDDV